MSCLDNESGVLRYNISIFIWISTEQNISNWFYRMSYNLPQQLCSGQWCLPLLSSWNSKYHWDNWPLVCWFVDTHVVQMWHMDMNVAWWISKSYTSSSSWTHHFHRKSVTNCAWTYDVSLNHGMESLLEGWSLKASALKGDHTYYGFTVLSLEDYCSCNTILVVSHTGDQADQFTEAVRERNMCIKCYGQPEIEHCCTKCMWLYNASGSEWGTT